MNDDTRCPECDLFLLGNECPRCIWAARRAEAIREHLKSGSAERLRTTPLAMSKSTQFHPLFLEFCQQPGTRHVTRGNAIGKGALWRAVMAMTIESDDKTVNQPPSHHVTSGGAMQPHQQRVVTEAAELDTRLTALLVFIAGNPIYQSLPAAERARLQQQSRHMEAYRGVLMERIDAFGVG